MTTLGIQYLEYLETQRSNRAQERIKQDTLNEAARSNRAQEYLKAQSINETIRANMAQESLKSQALDEQKRANEAMEKIKEQTRDDNYRVSVANAKLRFDELEFAKDKHSDDVQIETTKVLAQEGTKAVTSVINSAIKLVDAILPL